MTEYNVYMTMSNNGTRNSLRMRLVQRFSTEIPGTGRNTLASRYKYYVETLTDGNRIYLRRPANLYNGFDFLVCVENTNFNSTTGRRRNFPKHDDIIEDLRNKFAENPQHYLILHNFIRTIFDCREPNWHELDNLDFQTGFSCELITKTLKWLFIEQDIRFWNYSGRNMLWDRISSILPENTTTQ